MCTPCCAQAQDEEGRQYLHAGCDPCDRAETTDTLLDPNRTDTPLALGLLTHSSALFVGPSDPKRGPDRENCRTHPTRVTHQPGAPFLAEQLAKILTLSRLCYNPYSAFATVCSSRGGRLRPDSSPPFLPAVYLREIQEQM
jgi:hypothetical protein